MVEADLAFRGVDLRDLWRRGSGLTPRRLWVLIRALPPDALLWHEVQKAQDKALKPTEESIRDRQAYWDAKKAAAPNLND